MNKKRNNILEPCFQSAPGVFDYCIDNISYKNDINKIPSRRQNMTYLYTGHIHFSKRVMQTHYKFWSTTKTKKPNKLTPNGFGVLSICWKKILHKPMENDNRETGECNQNPLSILNHFFLMQVQLTLLAHLLILCKIPERINEWN